MKTTIQDFIQILGHLLFHRTETDPLAHSPPASASDRTCGSITLSVTILGVGSHPTPGEDFRTDLPVMPEEKAGPQNHSHTGSAKTGSRPWMEKDAVDALFHALSACMLSPDRPVAAGPQQKGISPAARIQTEPSEPAEADTATPGASSPASVAANFHRLHSILMGIPCPHCGQTDRPDQAR